MRHLLVFTLLAATPLAAAAQAPDSTLLLGAAVRRAVETHPTLAGAEAAARGAGAALGEAQSRWLPQVTSQVSLTRFQRPMVVAPLHGFTDPASILFDQTLIQGNLSLAYTLFDGGARGARIRGARADEDAREANVTATEADLIASVTGRYLGVLTARAVVTAQDDGVRALRAEHDRVAQLVAQGEVADVELLRVQAALAQAEADQIAAHASLEVAAAALARAVAVPRVAPDAVRPVRLADTTAVPRDEVLARLTERNPRLAEARRSADAARWNRRAAVAAWFPQLNAQGAVLGFGSGEGSFTTEWQVGVVLSYPLFLGGARGRAVSRAGAQAEQAEDRYRALLLDAEDAADRAASAVRETRAQADAVERAVVHLAEVVRIERLSLEAGAGTEAEYLRAEADLRRARAQLADARAAEITSRVDVARLTGDLTLEWLERTVENLP